MRVLDLFSGIGGFSLGLERAGFETVAFCEIDPYCRRVLARHWPEVPCYDDVRTLTAERLGADGIAVDAICGGFPCQDISSAGKGAGLAGEHSGLWREYARLVGELRPAYVIVENVAALLGRGLGTVLGDLAALGYDAQWHCIPAAAVGAPHRRDRVWIVAYPGCQRGAARGEAGYLACAPGAGEADGEERQRDGNAADHRGPNVADADSIVAELRQHHAGAADAQQRDMPGRRGSALADALRQGLHACAQAGLHRGEEGTGARHVNPAGRGWWETEPDVDRVADGVPARVDRLRALGNAVVPQIPELIGRAIMSENRKLSVRNAL
jgi:DNA (cytosine-5)-methyltransferase 1